MATNVAVLAKPEVEEIHYQKGDVSLCLMINRRTRSLRVVDFRAGTHPLKREVVEQIARDEGLERAYTVVEREEATSWLRLGFHKEGNIPGFYKRSDGHLCGCVINDRTASIEVSDEGVKRAERTIAHGKKNAREVPDDLSMVTVGEADDNAVVFTDGHQPQLGERIEITYAAGC